MTASTLDRARAESILRAAAAVFLVALLVHGADHTRRGFDAVTAQVMWLGNVQLVLSLVTVVLVFTRHRLAAWFAVGIGFASALGFTVAHLVPHWSSLSDSFTGTHPAPGVNAFSWFAAAFEIVAGLALGAAGVLALRAEPRE